MDPDLGLTYYWVINACVGNANSLSCWTSTTKKTGCEVYFSKT